MFTILNGQVFVGPRGNFTQNGCLYFLRFRTIHFGFNDFHPQITEGLLLSNRYNCLADYWLLWDERTFERHWFLFCVCHCVSKSGLIRLDNYFRHGFPLPKGTNLVTTYSCNPSTQEHLCHSDATGSVWLVKKGLQVPRALLPHTWDLGLLLGRKVDGPATWLVGQFPLSFLPLDRLLIHVDSNYHQKRKQQEVAILRYNSYHLSISFRFVHQNAIKKHAGENEATTETRCSCNLAFNLYIRGKLCSRDWSWDTSQKNKLEFYTFSQPNQQHVTFKLSPFFPLKVPIDPFASEPSLPRMVLKSQMSCYSLQGNE